MKGVDRGCGSKKEGVFIVFFVKGWVLGRGVFWNEMCVGIWDLGRSWENLCFGKGVGVRMC